MALLAVETALARMLDGVEPTNSESVDLLAAAGRVLACDLAAHLTQPPFDASAMDGYAVRAADVATLPTTLRLIGEAAAGHAFSGSVGAGEAVRIFTGAPVPAGADAIVIQENVAAEGTIIQVVEGKPDAEHLRRRGGDFREGEAPLKAGRRLTARDVTLAAAMGHATVPVRRRPGVAILATGDELVPPGETPRADQIISSNPYGLAAIVAAAGGKPRLLGIARDTRESLAEKIAAADGADVLLTIGGASVGAHDLVVPALEAAGMTLDFWKIAMRPGKPMIFGRRGASQRIVGLPGNPVSSLICTRVFVVPLIARLLGDAAPASAPRAALLAAPLEANGPRTHFMRGNFVAGEGGAPRVAAARSQDSSLLTPLAAADCLIVRPADAPPAAVGDTVAVLDLDF
jgi:molybdopterin molybdotransferase